MERLFFNTEFKVSQKSTRSFFPRARRPCPCQRPERGTHRRRWTISPWAGDKAGIVEPTARLMGGLGTLFDVKAQYARSEPLKRRTLAIGETSLGSNHPGMAIRLNDLAALLLATSRLAEAEPLMRRGVIILLIFQRDTGHAHPHRDTAINNYVGLLSKMDHDEAAIRTALADAQREAGLG